MMSIRLAGCALALAALAWGTAPDAAPSPVAPGSTASRVAEDRAPSAGRPRAVARSLPLFFETNRGQAPDGWDFLVRCRGYHAFVRGDGIQFSFDGAGLRLTLDGARDVDPDVAGLAMDARANYFLGNDPTRWIRGIPLSRGARYASVAPGTSWAVGGRGRALEFTFDVRGTEPSFTLGGARALEVDADGRLVAEMPHGRASFSAPVAWQDLASGRRDVAARFVAGDAGRVRIVLGAHDASRPVHVDPTVSYASYLGSTEGEGYVTGAIDADHHAYVAGSTPSADFPTTSGAYSETRRGSSPSHLEDFFVAKFEVAGDTLAWATYLGSSKEEHCFALEIDSGGLPIVGGFTYDVDYPTTSGVVGEKAPTTSVRMGALTKLTADGSDLAWSTYVELGVEGLALGPGDEPHCVAPHAVLKLSADASSKIFLGTVDAPGSAVTGNTYTCAAVDADANVYVGGRYGQVDTQYKMTAGTFQTKVAGGYDGLLVKYDGSGNALWRTLFGGAKNEEIQSIAVDGLDRPVFAGHTDSTDLPTSADAFQSSHGKTTYSDTDGFIARFSPDGKSLRYSTFVGGRAQDVLGAIRVHPTGVVFAAGATSSDDFPVKDPFQAKAGGGWDGWLLRLDSKNRLSWLSGYGGSGDDPFIGLGMAPDGTILAAGQTSSTDLPTTSAYQSSLAAAGFDANFLCIEDSLPETLSLPVVATTALPQWTVDVPLSEVLALTGGTTPFEWDVSSGSLPPGVALSADGDITGTPTEVGTFTFTVRVVDEYAFEDEGRLSMTIHPTPAVTTSSPLPDWTRDVPFGITLTASGGTGALSFAAADGKLPAGLSLDSDGRLAGTPTKSGRQTFAIDVTDSVGGTSHRDMEILVNVPVTIAASILDPCTEGRPYSHLFSSSGGTGAHVWSVLAGAVPTVEDLQTDGELSGTADDAGAYSFTLRAVDAVGGTAQRDFSATIHPFPAITTDALPPAAAGRRYSARVTGTGGTPPIQWTLSAGLLPPGLSVHPATGAMSGVPLAGGMAFPRFALLDDCGATAQVVIPMEVAAASDLTTKRTSETVILNAGSPRVLRHLELLAGTLLDVNVKGGVADGSMPTVTLVASDGTPVDLTFHTKANRKGVKVRKVPIPATDRYFLSVAQAEGAVGPMTISCSVAPSPGRSVTVPAGTDPVEAVFSAPPGAQVTITAKPAKKSAALPRIVSLLDGDGADLLPGGTLKEKAKSATFRTSVPLVGGDYRVLAAARDGTSGGLVVTVQIKLPKTYGFALPDLVAGDAE